MENKEPKKVCSNEGCKKEVTSKDPRAMYCSSYCKLEAFKKRHGKKPKNQQPKKQARPKASKQGIITREEIALNETMQLEFLEGCIYDLMAFTKEVNPVSISSVKAYKREGYFVMTAKAGKAADLFLKRLLYIQEKKGMPDIEYYTNMMNSTSLAAKPYELYKALIMYVPVEYLPHLKKEKFSHFREEEENEMKEIEEQRYMYLQQKKTLNDKELEELTELHERIGNGQHQELTMLLFEKMKLEYILKQSKLKKKPDPWAELANTIGKLIGDTLVKFATTQQLQQKKQIQPIDLEPIMEMLGKQQNTQPLPSLFEQKPKRQQKATAKSGIPFSDKTAD